VTHFYLSIVIFRKVRNIQVTLTNRISGSTERMSKRHRDSDALQEPSFLKSGDRPIREDGDEALEFEDEYEDEFESEDEIFEAGVDGRPDAEREDEEKGVRSSFRESAWRVLTAPLQTPWQWT
jgi:hypothetical protein